MSPLLAPIFSLVGTVIDRLIPDKAAAEKAKLEMAAALQAQEFQIQIEQIKVNAAEAANPSMFVAGWRPSVGWICSAGLAYSFVVQPMLSWASSIWQFPAPPTLDLSTLLTVLGGMLGMSGIRMVEKVKGVHRDGL